MAHQPRLDDAPEDASTEMAACYNLPELLADFDLPGAGTVSATFSLGPRRRMVVKVNDERGDTSARVLEGTA